MDDYIEIKHIKKNKRKEQVKDTAKNIGKGAGMIFKSIGKGVKKLADDIQERNKPENQLERLKTQKKILAAKAEVMKEQDKINKLKPKDNNSSMGGLGGLVNNAGKNMDELFGTNDMFNNNKKNNKNNFGGLI